MALKSSVLLRLQLAFVVELRDTPLPVKELPYPSGVWQLFRGLSSELEGIGLDSILSMLMVVLGYLRLHGLVETAAISLLRNSLHK